MLCGLISGKLDKLIFVKDLSDIFFFLNSYEPRHEKNCFRGLRPGKTQTSLLS